MQRECDLDFTNVGSASTVDILRPADCPLCHGTGWRTVQRNGREGVERCDHKPPEQDAKQRAAGDSGGEAA